VRILITGAAGFVGSAIARRLLNDGHSVIGVDSLSDYYDVGLKEANLRRLEGSGFRFISGDLNTLDLDAMLDGVEIVYHEAGQPGVRKSWGSDFAIYSRANIDATQRLLEAVRGSGTLKKFVYASSSSVYGDAEKYPTTETDLPRPVSPYGVTKLAGEHLCSLYASNFSVPTVSLRYFTVYGPGQRPDMAFTRFAMASANNTPITLYGTGEQIRDFTYIDDVVEANILAGFGSAAPGSVFNVAGGSSISVNEVLKLIETLSGNVLNIIRAGTVAGDVLRTGGSTAAIERELGWKPRVQIQDGLERQLAWAVSLSRQSVSGGMN
jgi:UDP-glucuronate 4-epimerase